MSRFYYWLSVKILFASVAVNLLIYVMAANNTAPGALVEMAFVSALTLVSVLALSQLFSYLFSIVQIFYGVLELYSFMSVLRDGFSVTLMIFLQSPLLLITYLMQIALCICAPAYVLFSSKFRHDFKELEKGNQKHVYFVRYLIIIAFMIVMGVFIMKLSDLIASFAEHD